MERSQTCRRRQMSTTSFRSQYHFLPEEVVATTAATMTSPASSYLGAVPPTCSRRINLVNVLPTGQGTHDKTIRFSTTDSPPRQAILHQPCNAGRGTTGVQDSEVSYPWFCRTSLSSRSDTNNVFTATISRSQHGANPRLGRSSLDPSNLPKSQALVARP